MGQTGWSATPKNIIISNNKKNRTGKGPVRFVAREWAAIEVFLVSYRFLTSSPASMLANV